MKQKAIIDEHNWEGCDFQLREINKNIEIVQWEHDYEKHTITIIYIEKI